MNITPGTVFSTRLPDGRIIESGCVALETPDEHGNFLGLDSDMVEVNFNTQMVAHIEDGIISLDAIVHALKAEDIDSYVEQTGGGCATVLVGEPYEFDVILPWNGQTITESAYPAAVGPGWFVGEHWTRGQAHVSDLSVGPDRDDLDDVYLTYFSDDNPATIEAIVAAVKKALDATKEG